MSEYFKNFSGLVVELTSNENALYAFLANPEAEAKARGFDLSSDINNSICESIKVEVPDCTHNDLVNWEMSPGAAGAAGAAAGAAARSIATSAVSGAVGAIAGTLAASALSIDSDFDSSGNLSE